MDSRRRTRRKRPSLSLLRSYLSSRYFLKLSKNEISRTVKFLSTWLDRRLGDLRDTELFSANHPRSEIHCDKENQRAL